ncbi:MAG: hypothetical protein Q9187_002632 [Circinaria calcarea]
MSLWRRADAYNRLLAALVASLDATIKIDYRKIAALYGREATYDSIEGRFRIIRKEAAQLREEVATGIRPAEPPRGGPKKDKDDATEDDEEDEHPVKKVPKPRTPKQRGNVLAGRVSKTKAPAKPRGRGTKGIKEEAESSPPSMMDEMLSGVGNDFGGLSYSFDGHGAFGAMGMDVDGDFDGGNV